jgi:hypothetical protein
MPLSGTQGMSIKSDGIPGIFLKSYVNNRRRELTFEVGDFVYLKVSPMRGMKRFKVKGKLSPRYIGPFKIMERKGEVAHHLELLGRA